MSDVTAPQALYRRTTMQQSSIRNSALPSGTASVEPRKSRGPFQVADVNFLPLRRIARFPKLRPRMPNTTSTIHEENAPSKEARCRRRTACARCATAL